MSRLLRFSTGTHRISGQGVFMSDQVVLITGALTGIGRAAAVIFAKQGAQVMVSGRRDKEGQELVAELRALGAEAEFVRTDVRVEEDVRNLVDETVSVLAAWTLPSTTLRLRGRGDS
jgi:NAD(P)-dependent dehydrogenase (short-subunit alcohol dehydrogenase family)